MKRSTQALALASARHPWRTIAAWAVAAVLAFVAIGVLLGGSLTSTGNPTGKPQSERARDIQMRAFPASSGASATDLIVVRSQRYTVASLPARLGSPAWVRTSGPASLTRSSVVAT